jgi:hypothetical protein
MKYYARKDPAVRNVSLATILYKLGMIFAKTVQKWEKIITCRGTAV